MAEIQFRDEFILTALKTCSPASLSDHFPFIHDYPWVFGLSALFCSSALLILIYRSWMKSISKRFPQLKPARTATLAEINELEQSIGGALATLMRNAYLDGKITHLSMPAEFNCDDGQDVIVEFFAIDAQSNRKFVDFYLNFPNDAFVFAADDFGNYYFVRAGSNSVYYWDHDGGDVSEKFSSLEKLWSLLGLEP